MLPLSRFSRLPRLIFIDELEDVLYWRCSDIGLSPYDQILPCMLYGFPRGGSPFFRFF